MMKKWKLFFLWLFAFVLLILPLGDSTFLIAGGVEDLSGNAGSIEESSDPVCYITSDSGSTKTYYTSLDRALLKASSNSTNECIVVLPGTKGNAKSCTLSHNRTVNSGDRLILPLTKNGLTLRSPTSYAETDAGTYLNPMYRSNINTYQDSSYIIMTLAIASNVTLTINGSLDVGGYYGGSLTHANQMPCGWTNYLATEIILGDGSSIAVSGLSAELNCYGFIREENHGGSKGVVVSNSATMTEPFIIYDFAGGTDLSYLIDTTKTNTLVMYCSPFDVFDFHNVESLTVKSNAKLIGAACLSTANSTGSYFAATSINLLGPSSSYLMQYSSSVALSVNPNEYFAFNTSYSAYSIVTGIPKANISFDGGGGINPIKINMTVSGMSGSVDTSKQFLSIPGNFTVTLRGGTYSFNQRLRFLTGSSLVVLSNATLNVNKYLVMCTAINDKSELGKNKVSFTSPGGSTITDEEYELDFKTITYLNKYDSSSGYHTSYYYDEKKIYPFGLSPAKLNLSGTLNVKACIGGTITSSQSGALVNIAGGIKSYSFKDWYVLCAVTHFINGYQEETNWSITEYARGENADGTITFFDTDCKGVDSSSYIYDGSKWRNEESMPTYSVDLDSIVENSSTTDGHTYDSSTHTYKIPYLSGKTWGSSWFHYGDGSNVMAGSKNKNYVAFDLTIKKLQDGGYTDLVIGINKTNTDTIRIMPSGSGYDEYRRNNGWVTVLDSSGKTVTEKIVKSGERQVYLVPLARFGDIKALYLNGMGGESITIHSITFYEDYCSTVIGQHKSSLSTSKEATVWNNGSKTYSCSVCGETTSEEIAYSPMRRLDLTNGTVGANTTYNSSTKTMSVTAGGDVTFKNVITSEDYTASRTHLVIKWHGTDFTTNTTNEPAKTPAWEYDLRMVKGSDIEANRQFNASSGAIVKDNNDSSRLVSTSLSNGIITTVFDLSKYKADGFKIRLQSGSAKFIVDDAYVTKPSMTGETYDWDLSLGAKYGTGTSTYDSTSNTATFNLTSDVIGFKDVLHYGVKKIRITMTISKYQDTGWGGTGDLYIYINDTDGSSHLARIPNEANWNANSTWVKVDGVTAYDSSGNQMEKVITEVGKKVTYEVDLETLGYEQLESIAFKSSCKPIITFESIQMVF